jgi:conjugative relaxase-like TrwC/TraI family protein
MMVVAQVKDTLYHIENTSENYQFIGGELPGVWAGTGAGLLGLTGEVDEECYLKLMEGKHPITGEHLYQHNGKIHRPAIDAVLSPDKSISCAWARANPETRLLIEKAHHQAVIDTLKFIERHAAYSRRGHNGIEHQKVVGFIAAVFQHSTSRAEDPLIHSHIILMNCARR